MKKALLVIDIQNDYFPTFKFPLYNTDKTLENIEKTIIKAQKKDIPIIILKHLAYSNNGIAPFFNEGTKGVEIHPKILNITKNPIIVVKTFADSFYKTNLEEILNKNGVEELFICGMMTQNCVTHTAISKQAHKFNVKILSDCCTTVNEAIHIIALNALTSRQEIEIINSSDIF